MTPGALCIFVRACCRLREERLGRRARGAVRSKRQHERSDGSCRHRAGQQGLRVVGLLRVPCLRVFCRAQRSRYFRGEPRCNLVSALAVVGLGLRCYHSRWPLRACSRGRQRWFLLALCLQVSLRHVQRCARRPPVLPVRRRWRRRRKVLRWRQCAGLQARSPVLLPVRALPGRSHFTLSMTVCVDALPGCSRSGGPKLCAVSVGRRYAGSGDVSCAGLRRFVESGPLWGEMVRRGRGGAGSTGCGGVHWCCCGPIGRARGVRANRYLTTACEQHCCC